MESILNHDHTVKKVINASQNAYRVGLPHYYVYLHKLNGQVFYVGKGSHDRVIRVAGRSKLWYETAFGKEIEVEIVTGLITQTEALEKENTLINQYTQSINKIFSKPKQVTCFSRNGTIIKNYSCINEVMKDGFKPGCVKLCCDKQRGLHKNCIWMYTSEYQRTGFFYKAVSNHSLTILQKDKTGNTIRELLTAAAFSKFGFNPKLIQQVCRGKKKSHLGYTFQYK